ncbi:MAG: hypothetical protein WCG78_01435 [Candidatus Omnitrophota bacterium]
MRKKGYILITALIIGAAVFYFYTGRGSLRTTTGLYEYIRAGYDAIEKKEYPRGIKLLRKAYEVQPGDIAIQKNLLDGYIAYADALDKKDDLDGALKVIAAASSIDPKDPDVVREAAYLSCQKGALLSGRKRLGESMEYYRKGVDLALSADEARKDIAGYLYTLAQDAYARDDRQTTLICLKSSYAIWERYETLDFIAKVYYRQANPEAAKFYWERAQEIDPAREGLDVNIKLAAGDSASQRQALTVETENFNIKLYKPYGTSVDTLEKMLRKVYADVGGDLGYYPDRRTPVIFYSEADYRTIFRKPSEVRAFYDGSIRIPLRADVSSALFAATLAHEYAHAVVDILTEKGCPLWINEGIAGYEQAREAPVPVDVLRGVLPSGEAISIDRIEKGFASGATLNETLLSYQGAYAAICFMLDKWGWAGMRGLLKRIREGRHYANAVDEEYLVSMPAFEEMLTQYARAHYLVDKGGDK